MKKIKKIVSLMLAMVMVFAMTMGVSAATNYTITVNNSKTGHTYEAYQIFAGDLEEGKLTNIDWGTGVNGANALAALKVADATRYGTCESAADVAKALEGQSTAVVDVFAAAVSKALTTPAATSNGSYALSVPAGYYLVKDKKGTVEGQDSYTKYIVKVAGENVTVEPKGTVPTVEKKVEENVKYNQDGGYGQTYNDVADWNMGDSIGFKLIGTLPENYAEYTVYTYTFRDTKSDGLTFNGDYKVYAYLDGNIKNTADSNRKDLTASFTKTIAADDANKLTVSCPDLKKACADLTNASKIVVEYTATLNQNAVIGLPGNPNTVDLQFSNNPNYKGDGSATGGPGNNGEENTVGTTPEDKVIVFTYKLGVNKVDGANHDKKLAGAEFVLSNAAGKFATVAGGKVTGWVDTQEDATKLITGETGVIEVAGLDDGTYKLTETKAPAGYNLLADAVSVTINATTVNGQAWNDFVPEKALTNMANGTATVTVENFSGATLPSTGGMGTTIFYVLGGILVLGAGVLLIAKRRVRA